MATGNLIVDSLHAQESTGAAVGNLALSISKAVNTVADVVSAEIAYRQELQQQTSVLLQKAGIQSLKGAPVVGTAIAQSIQASQATAGVVVAIGVASTARAVGAIHG